MKLGTSPTLIYLRSQSMCVMDDTWCVNAYPWVFYACDDVVRDIWDIPSFAMWLWLVVHNRPAKDRLAVVLLPQAGNDRLEVFFDDSFVREVYTALYLDLQRAMGDREKVYVECWYECGNTPQ